MTGKTLKSERGVALLLVMVVLLLLSILGMTLLNSTTTDLQISGNYRNDVNAFYAADAGLEFAQVHALIYTSLVSVTGSSWPEMDHGVLLNDDGTPTTTRNDAYPDYNQITIYKDPATKTQPQGTANVQVRFVGSGPVPAGFGTEVDAGLGGGGFKANFYVISVIADGPNSSSHAEVESQVARVVPK